MNINNVYLVKIYVKTVSGLNENYLYNFKGEFVKNALVYKCFNKNCPVYIDLETGRFYDSFQLRDALIGELYISIKDGLIPYISMVGTNRKNMTKRKILKKFDDTIKKNNNDSNIENDNK